MKRSILAVAVFSSACATHAQTRALDDVTTTSAVIHTTPKATVEAPAITDGFVGSSELPTPVAPQSALDDVRIALDVGRASDAATRRADLALRYARDTRVRDFAQLLRDRAREAKLQMSLISVTPDASDPPTSVQNLAGQSQVDFDRAYVALETRTLGGLIGMIDELTPAATASSLRQRLLALRPQLVDLWTRADELQQTLLNAP